nr:MAG: hypothetical protein 3 [Leviviridae sp.]
MRKYFTKKVYTERRRRIPCGQTTPWDVLAAYVQGCASVVGFDMLADFYSVSLSKSVTHLLNTINKYELSTLEYGSSAIYVKTARQLCALLKKYPFDDSDTQLTPREVAVATFRECEEKCRVTNERLLSLKDIPLWVYRARSLIRNVLGELEPSLIMKIIRDGEHGPGSTLTNDGKRVTPYYKYADFPYSVSKSASMYALAAISSNPRWMDILESSGRRTHVPLPGTPQYQKELQIFWDCSCVENSDSITFVPKDARTERPIAVGSSLNLFLQLGVKTYMEEKLKGVGIDLTDQTRNQELARQGSLDDSSCGFVTIDLSSASDTISYELVRLLLDPMWFAFLDDLRHKTGRLDGEIITYQKFSAMGNGFTFPLESLLFWAICKASSEVAGFQCTSHDISVFGDDIIVRKRTVKPVLQALEFAGFSPNYKKSFLAGPFRESCGRDYYSGNDVRPFYLKRSLRRYEDVYFLLNSISKSFCSRKAVDRGFVSLYTYIIRLLEPSKVNYIPMGDNSDGGLCVPYNALRSFGINPWLTPPETLALGIENSGSPICYYTTCIYRPRIFKGKEYVRLLVALGGKRDIPFYEKSVFSLELPSCNSITRRNAVIEAVSISMTPNWDHGYTYHQLTYHPLNFLKFGS